MEIFEQILEKLDKTDSVLESVIKHITKPAPAPVFKLDSAKLATELMPYFTPHRKALEDAVARMEAAAASIPRSVPTRWSIEPGTRWFLIFSILLIIASAGAGYFAAPKAERIASQEYIGYQSRKIETITKRMDYLSSKNPRDAARYDRANE